MPKQVKLHNNALRKKNFGVATQQTNIFNALSGASQLTQLQLMVLAESGDSPVSNAFTAEADRLGLTPQAREREDARKLTESLAALREQTVRFQEQLNRLDQASMEALLENEEQQRVAREELKRLQDRAYEITMPDGHTVKLYRDGNSVRDDDGAVVSPDIIKAEDISQNAPTWAERKARGDAITDLEKRRNEIIKFREEVQHTQQHAKSGDISADELGHLQADLDKKIPDDVRRHYGSLAPNESARALGMDAAPDMTDPALSTAVRLTESSNWRSQSRYRSSPRTISRRQFQPLQGPRQGKGRDAKLTGQAERRSGPRLDFRAGAERLFGRDFLRAADGCASCLRGGHARLGAFANQGRLKFSERSHDMKYKPSARRRRINGL